MVRTTLAGTQTLVDVDASQQEFAALITGVVATFVVGVMGAAGFTWLLGVFQNPGEPAFSILIESAAVSVRLPSGVDPTALSLSLSGIVLTLVLAVSLADPKTLDATPAAVGSAARIGDI